MLIKKAATFLLGYMMGLKGGTYRITIEGEELMIGRDILLSVDTEKFYNSFKQYLPTDDFKTLDKILYITATNLLNGTLKVFSDGELNYARFGFSSFSRCIYACKNWQFILHYYQNKT